ncbi:GRAM domain-containing protein [Phycomyces nitens]|nr:GRAM domain-containing protein [Phycomyces nitens]
MHIYIHTYTSLSSVNYKSNMSDKNSLQVFIKGHHRSAGHKSRTRLDLSCLFTVQRDQCYAQSVSSDSSSQSHISVSDNHTHIPMLLGGYTPSSAKSNHTFHSLFRSVPMNDHLIDVYKCAIQKEILHQGHIYVSEHHICFRSNIFGWVTTLVMAFTEIKDIKKRKTARIIPNGLSISTFNADHVFASLLFRDQTFELMIKLWKLHQLPEIIKSLPAEDECNDFDDQATLDTIEVPPIGHQELPLPKDTKHLPDSQDERQELLGDQSYSPKSLLSRSIASTVTLVSSYYPSTCECISNESPYNIVVLDQSFSSTVETTYKLFFETDFLKNYFDQRHREKAQKDSSFQIPKEPNYSSTSKTLHSDMDSHVAIEATTTYHKSSWGCTFELRTRTCIRKTDSTRVNLRITIDVQFLSNSLGSSIIYKEIIDQMKRVFSLISDVIDKRDPIYLYIQNKEILDRLSREERNSHVAIPRIKDLLCPWTRPIVSLIKTRSDLSNMSTYHVLAFGITLVVCWNLWMMYYTNQLLNQRLQESIKNTNLPDEDPFKAIFNGVKAIEAVLEAAQKEALENRQQLIDLINE